MSCDHLRLGFRNDPREDSCGCRDFLGSFRISCTFLYLCSAEIRLLHFSAQHCQLDVNITNCFEYSLCLWQGAKSLIPSLSFDGPNLHLSPGQVGGRTERIHVYYRFSAAFYAYVICRTKWLTLAFALHFPAFEHLRPTRSPTSFLYSALCALFAPPCLIPIVLLSLLQLLLVLHLYR